MIALMETEGVTLDLHRGRHRRARRIAVEVNDSVENIGARRLQTVMERVLDDSPSPRRTAPARP